MEITINVNGKPTEIELTDDQVAKIKKATTKITDRIKTFEDACAEIGDDEYTEHPMDRLAIIVKALNEGWEPNWNNSNEAKYFPYFKWTGSGFSYNYFVFWSSFTNVPSRLCFKNSELAIYAAKQFAALYNEYLN